MIIVRPIRTDDIESLMSLAEEAYPGMTTLPPDIDVLSAKITSSTTSIASKVDTPTAENYLLVMEDTVNKKLVGTAGIFARLGEDDQFYSYKINRITQSNKELNIKQTIETLNLTNHFEGFAEVATLYLTEPYRINGNGKLLARSRYLFMAEFRERFPTQVMADLRGYFDENGRSPFWRALGRNFFHMTYAEADLFGAVNGNQFIADLMPKHPIYVNLLPKDAQEVIGKPNDQGQAALAMLYKEGFGWNGHVDIFDGAPSVDAYIDQLVTVRDSKTARYAGELNNQATKCLVNAGNEVSFSACITEAEVLGDGDLLLPAQTIEALKISSGDRVRYVAF